SGPEPIVRVVAPPDAVEGPRRGHQRWPGQLLVTLQDLGIRRAVEHVVLKASAREADAGLAAYGDPEAGGSGRWDVDAVPARGEVEWRAGAGKANAGVLAGTEERPIGAPVIKVSARGGFPQAVDVFPLVLESFSNSAPPRIPPGYADRQD